MNRLDLSHMTFDFRYWDVAASRDAEKAESEGGKVLIDRCPRTRLHLSRKQTSHRDRSGPKQTTSSQVPFCVPASVDT
jgi:hypothetical protein